MSRHNRGGEREVEDVSSLAQWKLDQLAPLLRSIYSRNSGGCCLHVMVDDGNWDCFVDDDDCTHDDCKRAALILADMDLGDRERITHNGGVELAFADENGHILYQAKELPWAAGPELTEEEVET